MPTTLRPRRSVLYMPGSNARALEKGRELPADVLILDLEDSVAPDAKPTAREQVAAALGAGGFGGRELVVRINGLDSPWGMADVDALARAGADAILLPKVESAAMVARLDRALQASGGTVEPAIWCMMETPLGILNAAEIAAHPRLSALVMGTSDLAKDLHAAHTKERLPFLAAISWCVLAARAHGLAIIDGVHLDLADDEGLDYACRQGRDLGCDGKTLIHPKTLPIANRIFSPSPEEVTFARRVIEAHGEAVRHGKGVVVVDGKLIENLHVAEARRLVALAEAIERNTMDAAAPQPAQRTGVKT
jgi:citrate lyase subunit beta / citryl-CoA lyase